MTSPPPLKQTWLDRLKTDVAPKHADKPLQACFLCLGIVDSTLLLAHYTYVTMQTGNIFFVGLGVSNQNRRPYTWVPCLTSIGCFVLGCAMFAYLNTMLGPRRRGTLFISFFIQALLLIATALLVQSGAIPGLQSSSEGNIEIIWSQEALVVLLSIQAAGQIVASRALGYNDLPTLVVTVTLCDLVSDPKLFRLRNQKRDRRILAVILTFVGAITGGCITEATGDIYAVMWLVAGIKLLISATWLFWGEDDDGL